MDIFANPSRHGDPEIVAQHRGEERNKHQGLLPGKGCRTKASLTNTQTAKRTHTHTHTQGLFFLCMSGAWFRSFTCLLCWVSSRGFTCLSRQALLACQDRQVKHKKRVLLRECVLLLECVFLRGCVCLLECYFCCRGLGCS